MAVKRSSKSRSGGENKTSGGSVPSAGGADDRMLHPDFKRMAGMSSLALAVVGIASLVVYLSTNQDIAEGVVVYFAGWIVLGVLSATAAAALLTGRAWAQRFLLVFWLLVSALAFMFGLAGLLWGAPGWWSESISLAWVAWPTMVLAAAAAVLLVMASAPGSRLRYASMATVTVVAALEVAGVVNLIAHKDPVHKDLGSLGIYGVSEWTQNILADVDEPMTLTCIYTSTEEGQVGSEYRGRVMELLGEIEDRMRELDKEVSVANVTTDAEKAKVFKRLRGRLKQQAAKHVKFLVAFDKQVEQLKASMNEASRAWMNLPDGAYLAQWRLAGQFRDITDQQMKSLDELVEKISKETKTGKTVDYAGLITDVRTELERLQKVLEAMANVLKRLEKIPTMAAKNGKDALAAADEFSKALSAALESLGPAGAPAKDPKAVLTGFSEALAKAARLAGPAAKKLLEVGGEDNAGLVAGSRCWQVGSGPRSIFISDFYEAMSEELARLSAAARANAQLLAPDVQRQQIPLMRKGLSDIADSAEKIRKAAAAAVKTLAKADPRSSDLLSKAAEDKLFEPVLKKIKSLKDQTGKGEKGLPELRSDTTAEDLTEDNLVIVEVGDQFRIVGFDEVYPRRARQMRPGEPPEDERRVFNGDSAISAKILGMTQKPFATVYLTYLPAFGAQSAAMPWMPDTIYSPKRLQTLSRRLREANFEVKTWYLDERLEIREDKRPQVLILLPPSPSNADPRQMMRQRMIPKFFEQLHLDKIRAVIRSGIPAIVLTGIGTWRDRYTGEPAFQQINEYVRDDWGIEVKVNHKCLVGVPDENRPGHYNVNALSLNYLPVSTLTDHPIGKPLRGQRMLWSNATCPLVSLTDAMPEGVTHEPLLRVPQYRKNIWAVSQFGELIRRIEEEQGGLVRPRPGDITPPFDLAILAHRKAQEAENTGAESFAEQDILDWNALWNELGGVEESAPAGPAKRVTELMDPQVVETLKNVKKAREDWDKIEAKEKLTREEPGLSGEQKQAIVTALNAVIDEAELYNPTPRPPMPGQPTMGRQPLEDQNFRSVAMPREAQILLDHKDTFEAQREEAEEAKAASKPAPPKKVRPFTRADQRRFNRLLLEAAFPKILADTRGIKASDLVVLGMGMSFFDDYLDRPVLRLSPKGGVNLDTPPHADADLMVAAAYYLADKEEYIAAGPVQIEPVDITPAEKNVLWVLCVIGLPIVVVAAGMAVMFVRRR